MSLESGDVVEVVKYGTYIIVAISVAFITTKGYFVKSKFFSVGKNKSTSSIPREHIYRYGKIIDSIKKDIRSSRDGFKALFRGFFTNYLKGTGVDHKGIENDKNLHIYEVYLERALEAIYIPDVSSVVFGNHFPVKGEYNKDETDIEFEKRFREKLSVPTTRAILTLTSDMISNMWEIEDISRGDYESEYILKQETENELVNRVHRLLRNCQTRRDYGLGQLSRFNGVPVETLNEEWDFLYGRK